MQQKLIYVGKNDLDCVWPCREVQSAMAQGFTIKTIVAGHCSASGTGYIGEHGGFLVLLEKE